MTGRSVRHLLAPLLAFTFLLPSAFGQGSKMKSPYDPIEEADKDNPGKRAEWMSRGREAPKGQSAATLRLRAHQQKMAMRAQREAAAASQEGTVGSTPFPATGWVGLGPAPLVSDSNFFGMVSGRATSVAIDPSDATGNTVYVGGAYGGVWKSTNAANAVEANVEWTPVTDQQASLATGAVSVKPDGTVALVGTGEPNNAIDSYYGVGILRSTDKGATWTLIPSADGVTHPFAGLGVSKFAWIPSSNTVVAATATTAKGVDEGNIAGSNRGLYLSTNAGQTWAYRALSDGSTPISATDVVYNATAGKFFASIRSHGVYSSPDGTTWTRLANQPNPTALSAPNCPVVVNNSNPCPMYRGQFAVVPGRNETYFWFVNVDSVGNMIDEGIWRSLDGGGTWQQISETGLTNCGDSFGCGVLQSFYNLEIAAVPNGSGITDLYAGTINLYKCKLPNNQVTCSTVDSNLANSWLNLTHVYGSCFSKANVHPDEHGMDFMVVGGEDIMYFANDGGVYRALDGYTGLNIGSCSTPGNNQFDDLNATVGSMTQFVSFSIHPTDQHTVLGGTQDNGSPGTSTAINSPQWITVNGGDGGYNAINPTTPTQWFTANTDVSIQRCNSGISCDTNTFLLVVGNSTVGGDAGPFYTPYILDPQNSGELLVGTCRVWRGTTGGVAFNALSPNFDTGGTGQAGTCTGFENGQVRSIAAGGSKVNNFSNVVYATTDGVGPLSGRTPPGGDVWVTTNAATTLMTSKTGSINQENYTISSVVVDSSDATGQTAYLGIMGFGVPHVFKTTNAGGAWTNWTGSGLPDAPVNALLVDSVSHLIYAGTDVGVFVTPTTAATWTEVGPLAQPGATGYLPNVPVSAIQSFNSGGVKKLRVSTYGRGIWEFDLAPPAPDYQISISNTPLTVLQNQPAATFSGTLTAVGTYSSAVTLSCGAGAPGTCTFPQGNPITPMVGGANFSVAMPSGAVVQNYSFNIHAVGADGAAITHDAPVVLQVTDFSMTAPGPIAVAQGSTSPQTPFTLSSLGPFNGTVNLSCLPAGLPAGASCGFSPSMQISLNPANPSQLMNISVTAAANTPLGNSTVTISALTTGEAAKTTAFTLNVVPPDFAWAINGSNSATVLSGQTGTYNFTATPSGGTFASTVTFACGNLPAQTTCSFVPSSIPATTTGTQPVQLTIATAGPNPPVGASRRASNRNPWLPLTLPIAGLLLASIARREIPRHYVMLALCLTLAMTFISCGGGSSGPPPPPPITVTVSAGVPSSLFPNNTPDGWPAQTAQFTATVTGTTNTAVTWSVSGGAANGTIDSNGLYTAPNVAPGLPASATITATSQANSAKSGSSHETLNPATIPGTYNNVTVTASDSQVALSQTVTLVVQ
jgi:hypothetical protein